MVGIIGERLPADVLARRDALPLKPAPVTLEGRIARLVPLDLARDAEALHAVSNGEPVRVGERAVDGYDAEMVVWRYMPGGPFASAAEFAQYHAGLMAQPNLLAMLVIDVASGAPVGVTTFMSNAPEHLKIELGNIWYSPVIQRAGHNLECTYLMLSHAFELGYRRVEWKCDALNERSRRSALRMGFAFEGIQEAHFIIKGRNRDTAWFRILDREWPEVRVQLERMLAELS